MKMPDPLEKTIHFIRDKFWLYPDTYFFGEQSYIKRIFRMYNELRPISHYILFSIFLLFVMLYLASNITLLIRADNNTLIEGILVGIDEAGNMNSIQKVNPLIVTNIQIEKDLSELIYESLVTVDIDGKVNYKLAETIAVNEAGDNYRVKLREDIYWHDGEKFTTKDVKTTFEALERLDNNFATRTIYSNIANKKIRFIPIEGDDYRFEFQLDGAVPNFYELISFKILPAKYIADMNQYNALSSDYYINKNPIGTGMYKLNNAGSDFVLLSRFDDYYEKDKIPKIENIKLKFYLDEESLLHALTSGQVHSVAGFSSNTLKRIKSIQNLNAYYTGPIYTQYYGLYFNLSENGPPIFKNIDIRRAISSAINRDYIINILEGEAIEAEGPISKSSFAFTPTIDTKECKMMQESQLCQTNASDFRCKCITRYRYNPNLTNKLLDDAGWILDTKDLFRKKDGKVLEFLILSLDNVDRNKIVDSISSDLREVGIKANIIRKPYLELVNDYILPRHYEALLFAMTTFIDPDRYEFFHSSQITYPGLNIGAYKSEEETVKIDENKQVIKVPEVDYRLEKGRRILDEKARIEEYYEFQRIIGNEVPVVFLYHPILNYVVNQRVKGINLSNTNNLEGRFNGISDWYIKL